MPSLGKSFNKYNSIAEVAKSNDGKRYFTLLGVCFGTAARGRHSANTFNLPVISNRLSGFLEDHLIRAEGDSLSEDTNADFKIRETPQGSIMYINNPLLAEVYNSQTLPLEYMSQKDTDAFVSGFSTASLEKQRVSPRRHKTHLGLKYITKSPDLFHSLGAVLAFKRINIIPLAYQVAPKNQTISDEERKPEQCFSIWFYKPKQLVKRVFPEWHDLQDFARSLPQYSASEAWENSENWFRHISYKTQKDLGRVPSQLEHIEEEISFIQSIIEQTETEKVQLKRAVDDNQELDCFFTPRIRYLTNMLANEQTKLQERVFERDETLERQKKRRSR